MLLTNSEMRTWRRCKRQWYLGQYRQLRKRRDNEFNRPLGIGNRIHDSLAAYYDPDESRDPLEIANASIAADLAKHPELEEDIRKEADMVESVLTGYVDWLAETGADDGLEVIEAEKAVMVPLGEVEGVDLLSKLDARVRHSELGGRYALEHKTVSGSVKPPAHLRFDTQFLTEHLVELLSLRADGREDEVAAGVLWNALLKSKRTARAKGPFYAREVVRHNLEQLRNHWRHVVAIATEILDASRRLDNGETHHAVCHPNPTHTCSWDCPFLPVCHNLDSDPENAERQLGALYETGDVLARYRGLIPELAEQNT